MGVDDYILIASHFDSCAYKINMELFVCIPQKKIQIKMMLSCIDFHRGGKYDHIITFLLENNSSEDTELLILYPFVFPANEQLYRCSLNAFGEVDIYANENEFNWNISETYQYNPADSFGFDDPNAEGYSYRGLYINAKRYHGWISYTPVIDRIDVANDLQKTLGKHGYTIFKLRFPRAFPLKQNLPHWVRLHFNVDKSIGSLQRIGKALIDKAEYVYDFADPYTVKNNFCYELDQKGRNGDEQQKEMVNELGREYGYLKIDKTKVELSNYYCYLRFKGFMMDEIKQIVTECSSGNNLHRQVAISDPCFKIHFDSLSDDSRCKVVAFTKEAAGAIALLKSLFKFIPWPQ